MLGDNSPMVVIDIDSCPRMGGVAGVRLSQTVNLEIEVTGRWNPLRYHRNTCQYVISRPASSPFIRPPVCLPDPVHPRQNPSASSSAFPSMGFILVDIIIITLRLTTR